MNEIRINANEMNVLDINAEAKRLAEIGWVKEDFMDGGNFYLPEDLRGYYSWEEGEAIMELLPESAPNMEELAMFINDMDEYDNEFVESYCEKAGWVLDEDEWHICHDENKQIMWNDDMEAVVVEL